MGSIDCSIAISAIKLQKPHVSYLIYNANENPVVGRFTATLYSSSAMSSSLMKRSISKTEKTNIDQLPSLVKIHELRKYFKRQAHYWWHIRKTHFPPGKLRLDYSVPPWWRRQMQIWAVADYGTNRSLCRVCMCVCNSAGVSKRINSRRVSHARATRLLRRETAV